MNPEKPVKMPKEQPFSAEKDHKVLTITREELAGKFQSEEETKRYFSQKTLTPPDPSTPFPAVMETETVIKQERREESSFELPQIGRAHV